MNLYTLTHISKLIKIHIAWNEIKISEKFAKRRGEK